METANFRDIDEYISAFPPEVREKLAAIREIALLAAPDATEAIRYNMPAILQNGYLLYFAAFKKHISLFPAPPVTVDFFEEVRPYLKNKSTIQIPLKQDFPLELVTKLVKYRWGENMRESEKKPS